jgi:hypothetical protein
MRPSEPFSAQAMACLKHGVEVEAGDLLAPHLFASCSFSLDAPHIGGASARRWGVSCRNLEPGQEDRPSDFVRCRVSPHNAGNEGFVDAGQEVRGSFRQQKGPGAEARAFDNDFDDDFDDDVVLSASWQEPS